MEPNKNKSKRTKRKADEAKNLKNRTVHNLCTQSPWYEQSVVSNICEKDTFEASWNEKVKWLMKRMSVENVHLTICCTAFCNCCFFTAISPPNSRVFWVGAAAAVSVLVGCSCLSIVASTSVPPRRSTTDT